MGRLPGATDDLPDKSLMRIVELLECVSGVRLMSKLTLSADPEVIDLAKKIAALNGTSVSDLFSQFIRSLDAGGKPSKLAPLTRRATGIIRLPRGKSDRKLIEHALVERYGR